MSALLHHKFQVCLDTDKFYYLFIIYTVHYGQAAKLKVKAILNITVYFALTKNFAQVSIKYHNCIYSRFMYSWLWSPEAGQ